PAPAAITAPESVAVQFPAPAVIDRPRPDLLGAVSPDGATSRPETNSIGHGFSTESAVWSPDGKIIAHQGGGGGAARPVSLCDPFTGRVLRQLAPKETVRAVAFSPDGKTLAAAEGPRGVVLWDVGSGKELDRITGAGDSVGVAFAPDGRTL